MRSHARSAFEGSPATRLTLLMTFHDHAGRKGLEMEVLRRARKAKMAGLTVFEAVEGFGNSGHVHRGHLLSGDAPLAVVIVDAPEKVQAFLDAIGHMLTGIRVVVEDVEILHL
jgi:PII-like signaling protein